MMLDQKLHPTSEDFLISLDLDIEYPFLFDLECEHYVNNQILWSGGNNEEQKEEQENVGRNLAGNANVTNNCVDFGDCLNDELATATKNPKRPRRGSRFLFLKNRGKKFIKDSCHNYNKERDEENGMLLECSKRRCRTKGINSHRRRTKPKKYNNRKRRIRRVKSFLGNVKNRIVRKKGINNGQHYYQHHRHHYVPMEASSIHHHNSISSLTVVDALPGSATPGSATSSHYHQHPAGISLSTNSGQIISGTFTLSFQHYQQQEPLPFWMSLKRILPVLHSTFHLFARVIAPVIVIFTLLFLILYIVTCLRQNNKQKQDTIFFESDREDNNIIKKSSVSAFTKNLELTRIACSVFCLFNSMIMLTDEMYIIEYSRFNLLLFYCLCALLVVMASSVSSTRSSVKEKRRKVALNVIVLPITFISILLMMFCHIDVPDYAKTYKAGLYYDKSNSFISSIVMHWPVEFRTYDENNRRTPFLNGDTRTFIPWLVNTNIERPNYIRRWVKSIDPNENEAVLLDITFPIDGKHRKDKPLYFVLGGLSSGSEEKFVQDLVHRVTSKGSTIAVMTMRGLQNSPIVGDNIMHFARISDVEASLRALRKAVGHKGQQTIVGVGYSMGGMVLSNYVATTCSGNPTNGGGSKFPQQKEPLKAAGCKLDAAISVSSVLDPVQQEKFHRSLWLWQTILTHNFREKIMKAFTPQISKRLDSHDITRVRMARNMRILDEALFVKYFGFNDTSHYYTEAGAMSGIDHSNYEDDISFARTDDEGDSDNIESIFEPGNIVNIKVPCLSIFALDDPIAYYRGLGKDPAKLSIAGNGNLMFLITKAGGHVGWPMGINPARHRWKWMNDAISSFTDSVHIALEKSGQGKK